MLGDILISHELITSEQCQEAIAYQANIPFLKLDSFSYEDFAKGSLPRIISRKYSEKNQVLPLSMVGNALKLALLRPSALHVARDLQSFYQQWVINCVLVPEDNFLKLFKELYGVTPHFTEQPHFFQQKELPDTSTENVDIMEIDIDEGTDTESQDSSPYGYYGQDIETEELVNYIIKYGIKNKASDIHIDQDRAGVTLRFRIDGVMKIHDPDWLHGRLQESPGSIISRIKVMSNLDISEKRLPQDGVFRITYMDKSTNFKSDLDFRVATCAGITGENVTIRILDSRNANVGLDHLGHLEHVLTPFKRHLASTAGIILVTGPTGSGKSSTLYGALKYVYDPGLKIITAEDPIEYSFPGIMQTQINPKINLGLSRLLRSFLRLDPDVILVGEIRDNETAEISFDAAQTGHLVLSTLHTNDSISSISRLIDLGIDYSQITASISCILAQRLVRKICASCITEHEPPEEEWSLVFPVYPKETQFFKGVGCPACDHTGFKGRTLLSEIFVLEDQELIQQGTPLNTLKKNYYQKGMKNMLVDGLMKLSSTTLSELIRVLPYDMLEDYKKTRSLSI